MEPKYYFYHPPLLPPTWMEKNIQQHSSYKGAAKERTWYYQTDNQNNNNQTDATNVTDPPKPLSLAINKTANAVLTIREDTANDTDTDANEDRGTNYEGATWRGLTR